MQDRQQILVLLQIPVLEAIHQNVKDRMELLYATNEYIFHG